MAVSQSIMARNEGLIKNHLMAQIDTSLDVGAEALSEELTGASILLRPMLKGVYDTIVRNELKNSTKKIINGIIKMCKQMVDEDVEDGSEEFNRRLDEKFPAYLKIESTGQQCRKNHRNFPLLKENLRKTFEWQVRPVMKLLQVEKDAREYADLCRATFCRDELKQTLEAQTTSMLNGIEIIEQDKSILKLPAGKDLFLRVLRKGFDRKVEDFKFEIDQFYS